MARTQPGLLPILVNKVYWNTVMFILLNVISDCIHATMAELTVAKETIQPTKPQIFTIWLFREKVC